MIVVKRLVWNSDNITHIARHDVTTEEVEEVCQNNPYIDKGKKGRLRLIGLTKSNRLLAIYLDNEEEIGIYYPVTARPASKKERHLYQEQKGGEN